MILNGKIRPFRNDIDLKEYHMKKFLKTKGVIIIIVGFLVMAVMSAKWLITQPMKSIEINVLWMAPMPKEFKDKGPYRPSIEGRQQIAYRIRYIWDGVPHEKPWWIISRLADGKWRVCEPANTDSYDLYSCGNALFDDRWIKGGFQRIQRTRVQKFQHIVFGTEHEFQMEKEALRKIQDLIEIQERFELKGTDLFESMKSYIDENPGLATFWPSNKEHYNRRIEQLKKELLEEGN